MLFVLDSNEYIFAFGSSPATAAQELLDELVNKPKVHAIRIARTIFEEVKRNLTPDAFQEFNNLINNLTIVDEDVSVPFELGLKYESMHLKPTDAFIAAFVEWVGADALVTENRHFLTRQENLPFKVVNAQNCLKMLSK